jgi:hypothetical protein
MNDISLDESFFDGMQERDALLAEQVKIVDDYIIINVCYEYPISLDTCTTHEGILHWAWHLTEKTWMTNEVLRRFIELACRHAGLNYRN